MDARVFFHLTDSIATASSAAELAATGDLIRASEMHPTERRVLERAVRRREEALRASDGAVPQPTIAPRAD